VEPVRRLLDQRHLATLLCAAVLLVKLLVPAGYMIESDRGHITISICSGTAPRMMTMEVPGLHGGMADHAPGKDHGKAEMPCAFAGLSAAALGAIDPVQLAALIAFVVAIGLSRALLPAPFAPARLRPPLRGPPATL
jgi:hypothetical protein